MDQRACLAAALLLAMILSLISLSSSQTFETISTPSGPIKGINVPVNSKNIVQFRNIPFAKPPIGDLRFRKPVASVPWTNILDATSFGPICIQSLDFIPEMNATNSSISEDCLNLNIYVPEKVSLENKKSVMVWIHGGGFSFGSGSSYDVSLLALGGDVITVTINYRLGVLGFLSTEDSASLGNFGLWDQIMAFKWVKNNIAAFGGDPESITIFGESAGSFSISLHMLIPANRGLFHRAIGQSGAATSIVTFSRNPLNFAKDIAQMVNCSNNTAYEMNTFALIECMRKISAEDILQAQNEYAFYKIKIKDFKFPMDLWPVVDGDLFNSNPIDALKDDNSYVRSFYQSIDLIGGATSEEGAGIVLMFSFFQDEFQFNVSDGIPTYVLCDVFALAAGRDVFNDKTIARNLFCEYYKRDFPVEQGRQMMHLHGDVFFYASTIEALDYHSLQNMQTKTFQYLFSKASDCDFIMPLPGWAKGEAIHGEDILYLFGPEIMFKKCDVSTSESSLLLQKRMIKYWTNFAKTGDPNGNDLPVWPVYKKNDRVYIDFDDDITIQKDLFSERINLHNQVIQSAIEQNTKVITTPVGLIKGINVPVGSDNVLQFRNIPYAKAPVGNLRFRRPVVFGKWENTFDATAFGPSCIQDMSFWEQFVKLLPNKEISEDCLSLNIYVPSTIDLSRKKSVMVWIHGGSFAIGQGAGYDGSWLALGGDVIVVTINYRLGFFGFMSTEDEASPGNYGLWDQIMALQWIQNNIAAFGGDQNSVTIFGESAGSFSVTLQMLIPENRGLFQRVIGQSGVATSFITFSQNPLTTTVDFAEMLNCSKEENQLEVNTFDLVECLRSKQSDVVLEVGKVFSINKGTENKFWFENVIFWPVIDNDLFKQGNPINLLSNRNSDVYSFFHSIDLLAGTADFEGIFASLMFYRFQDEYKFNSSDGIPKPVFYNEFAPAISGSSYNGQKVAAKAIYEFYQRDSNEEQAIQLGNLLGDAMFIAPLIEFMDLHSNNNDESSTYHYLFSRAIDVDIFSGLPYWVKGKAHHFHDVFFLFGPTTLADWYNPYQDEELGDLSVQMIKYWTNFAKKGNPNDVDLPSWTTYNSKERSYIDLGKTVTLQNHVFQERITLLLETIPAMMEKSTAVIDTPSGFIRGIHVPVNSQNVIQFRNIPYAKPPVKSLRFRKPVPFGRWTGTLDATAFGPICVQDTTMFKEMAEQLGKPKMSEDCLSLNIYVPHAVSKKSKRSVMVWIHGGGFLYGQGNIYDGSLLALEGDVIVVTLNYRLGAFGFLTTGNSTAPGNYGLWDQRLAMQWVKDNIEAFGGNSESITLFGESAGSMSVTYQMLIPENKGLFHRAIAESGSAIVDIAPLKEPFDMSKSFGKAVQCLENIEDDISSIDLMECMRKVDANTILQFQNNLTFSAFTDMSFKTVFLPIFENELFQHGNPVKLLSDPNSVVSTFYKSVDFIGGVNSLDGSIGLFFVLSAQQSLGEKAFNVSEGIPTSFLCDKFIPSLVDGFFNQDKTIVEKVFCDFYSRDNLQEQGKQLLDFYGDILFVVPKVKTLNFHSNKNQISGTYQYLFSHGSGFTFLVPIYDWTTGAGHSEDLLYLFGPDGVGLFLDTHRTAEREQLSKNLLKYWTNFAKTGNPNCEGLPEWPQYDSTEQRYLNIDLEIKEERKLYEERVKLYLETIPELRKQSKDRRDRSEL